MRTENFIAHFFFYFYNIIIHKIQYSKFISLLIFCHLTIIILIIFFSDRFASLCCIAPLSLNNHASTSFASKAIHFPILILLILLKRRQRLLLRRPLIVFEIGFSRSRLIFYQCLSSLTIGIRFTCTDGLGSFVKYDDSPLLMIDLPHRKITSRTTHLKQHRCYLLTVTEKPIVKKNQLIFFSTTHISDRYLDEQTLQQYLFYVKSIFNSWNYRKIII